MDTVVSAFATRHSPSRGEPYMNNALPLPVRSKIRISRQLPRILGLAALRLEAQTWLL